MTAKHLMIGDWVRVTNDGSVPLPGKIANMLPRAGRVIGIECDSVQLDFVDFPFMLDSIEPIPITHEILEKNGWKHEFDKKDYMVKYDLAQHGKNCWMMWSVKEHNLDVQRQDEKLDMYNLKVSKVVIPCDYVHQLQHTLRLCGIDKEITI